VYAAAYAANSALATGNQGRKGEKRPASEISHVRQTLVQCPRSKGYRGPAALDDTFFWIRPSIENTSEVVNFTDNCHSIDGYLEDAAVATRIYGALTES
jgi:hypothetical protein